MNSRPTVARSYSSHGLHGRLVHELGLRIVTGQFSAGDTLPTEEKLVVELGVGRSALREAVKVLAGKGLLLARPKIGTQVQAERRWNLLDPDVLAWRYESEPTAEQLDDLAGMRVALEPEAARLAARMRDRGAVRIIRADYEAMASTLTDTEQFIANDLRFHRSVIEASANQLLIHLNDVMSVALAAARQVHTRDARRNRRTLPGHLAVLEAIENRDADRAASLMRALVQGAQHDIRRARTATQVRSA
jgi:DNA-binding FadR family transcriptional regulator